MNNTNMANKILKIVVVALGVVIVTLIGVFIFVKPAHTPSTPPADHGSGYTVSGTPNSDDVYLLSADGRMKVRFPLENAMITPASVFTGTVTGGGWFFENSFPVKVLDGDGTLLGTGLAHTSPPENWMSTGTVSFTAQVDFKSPKFLSGNVVFAKDNPSGLPENAAEMRVPVMFASSHPGKNQVVNGVVLIGPTCPVQSVPPKPSCADRPYPTAINISNDMLNGAIFTSIKTDASGAFSVSLPATGQYTFTPKGGQLYPRCAPQLVIVAANGIFPMENANGADIKVASSGVYAYTNASPVSEVTLRCDTGIR